MVVCVLRWGRWDWTPSGSSSGVSNCRSDGEECKPGGEKVKLASDARVTEVDQVNNA